MDLTIWRTGRLTQILSVLVIIIVVDVLDDINEKHIKVIFSFIVMPCYGYNV